MPFTFSHPALILPLAYLPKRLISMTGLIAGSIVPDFEYFIRMEIRSDCSHSLLGLLLFNLPLGLLLCFVFHGLIRNSLYANLPGFMSRRLLPFTKFDWFSYFKSKWIVVLVSIIIGAASHLLWDGFTHPHGYFVERIDLLTSKVDLFGLRLSGYSMAQHFSSLIGGLAVIIALFKLPTSSIRPTINLNYWIVLMAISASIMGVRFFFGLELRMIGSVIVTAISSGLIGLVITPLIIRTKLSP